MPFLAPFYIYGLKINFINGYYMHICLYVLKYNLLALCNVICSYVFMDDQVVSDN